MANRQRPRAVLARFVLVTILLVTGLALVGCGSEKNDSEELGARTDEIARAFAASGDLETARAGLQGLGVANPLQWLIYSTEGAIQSNVDPELTRAYVALALEMDVKEATIRSWAQANGIVDSAAATAAASGATLAAAVQQPVPTLAPTPAPVAQAEPTVSIPLTTTAATTSTASNDSAAAATLASTAVPLAASLTVAEYANLRAGPGTDFNLVGSLAPSESATIIGKNDAGDWWQIRTAGGTEGWVFNELGTTSGAVDQIAVALNIPTPPPTVAPTAAPAVVEVPTTVPAAPVEPPAAEPTAAPVAGNPSDQPYFSLVMRRMWTKEENGACAGQHLLRISVVDANGAPLNGITLRGIYTGVELTTGDQGKGDGRIEYDLYGTGEGFRVVRNNDGREAGSDNAEGFTTKSLDIDIPTLIGGGYCSDEADCQIFYNSYGCTGHHSWEAQFKRNY
jgi:uncharacterized protein YraI